MSSERSWLLKSRAESFARSLQTRLRGLSESQGQGEPWAEGAEPEVYYDIESPQEEAPETLYIAAQNRDNLLQRSDSEASTYYDTLEDLRATSPITARSALPVLINSETGVASSVKNGFEHFLENNTSVDHAAISSLLKLKHDPFVGNINSFSDAGKSGTFESLLKDQETIDTETDNGCDISDQEENNNVGKEFEDDAELRLGLVNNNCDVTAVEVDTRQTEDEYLSEIDIDSKELYCVYCDIEQKKSSISSDCSELSETSRTTCESLCQEFNGNLEEDLCLSCTTTSEDDQCMAENDHSENNQRRYGHTIPKICIDRNTSNCSSSSENIRLSNLLQELKLEIINQNNEEKESLDREIEEKQEAHSEESNLLSEPPTIIETKIKRNEDEEFDLETKRKYFQRSSSLKTGKTPPGTPGRKKIVRFADVLGLDLADVKTFLDEVPTVPKSAFEDLHGLDLTPEQAVECLRNSITVVAPQVEKVLTPLFQQPCVQPNFLDRVRQNSVALENALVSDMSLFAISGLVRVKNVDFHKSVHVRYTVNGWHSFSDLQARYIPNSCDGFSDKFSFVLYAHTLGVGQRIEFAVRFQAAGTQHWDNNNGINYVFVCNSLLPSGSTDLPSGLAVLPSGLPGTSDDDSAAFY